MSMVKLLIVTRLLMSFRHESAQAAVFGTAPGPKPRSAAAQPAPGSQPRAGSPGSQSQVTAPGLEQTGTTNQHQPLQKLSGTTNVYLSVDLGTPHIGGKVYSTGTDDIVLTVLTPTGAGQTRTVFINGKQIQLPNPNISGFINSIYVLSPGPQRFLASNRQYGRQVNLGKFPPGEIIFAIRTPDNSVYRTGDGTRNPDQIPHAVIKAFRAGPIEVWFEDLPGNHSDRDFNDAVFQLSGGVSDDNSVAELLNIIKEEKGEARDVAITSLRKINPKAAAMAGL